MITVQSNDPHTIDDLKMDITEYIRNVDCALLSMVFENTFRRANKCLCERVRGEARWLITQKQSVAMKLLRKT
jgi:hypothetical protein